MPSDRPVALVLRALGLGDLLAGVPALRALRRALPDHEVVLATSPVQDPLVRLTRAVDRLLPQAELEAIAWSGGPPDVAVDLHGNGPASHDILAELRPGRLVAFDRPGAADGRPVWDDDEHERHRWCRLVTESWPVSADPDDLLLDPPGAEPLVDGAIVVHPGAAFPARRWPPDRFAAVAGQLRDLGPVVVTGGPGETGLARQVAAAAGLPDAAVLAGRTDVHQLAALVSRARLVVCGDTGTGHLATAYRTPSVLLFGPTPPHRWGPPAHGPHTVIWKGDGVGDPWARRPDPALLRIGTAEVVEAARARIDGTSEAGPGSIGAAVGGTTGPMTRLSRDTQVNPSPLPDMGRPDAALAGFEQGPIPTLVALGAGLRVCAVNGMMRQFLGRDLLGRTLPEAFAELFGPVTADRIRTVHQTGDPYVGREWRLAPEDAPDTAHHFVDLHVSPWRDPAGEIVGVIAQGVDLTERVSARRAVEDRIDEVAGDYQHASEVVTAMQDALLPTDLPVVPGVEVAARYLLQENLSRAGGDWFDAIAGSDGRLVLVVGDVVGSGVSASAIMGQLRAVLHERLSSGAAAPDALVSLDRFARGLPEAHAATACIARLDPGSGELTYCTAGHPPPLVLPPHADAHFLLPTGGRPLGVSHRAATPEDFPMRTVSLEPDAMLLLYSDGAVERPGRSSTENTVELARVVSAIRETSLDEASAAQLEVERVCERTLDVLAWLSGYDDDITILAAQRVATVVPLDVRVPAVPASADRLRGELGRWLDSISLRELDRTVLVHAANELASNAIDHAYPRDQDAVRPPGAVVEMRAELLTTGVVEITVCDRGRWRDPDLRERFRGRGLALTAGLVDELDLEHDDPGGESGTVAKVRHRVRRAASLLTPMGDRSGPRPTGEEPFAVEVDDRHHRLHVRGAVDEPASDKLLAVLRTMSRGGAVTVSVDLSAVTQLPSVAVRVLYEASSQMQPPAVLRLLAGMGTPAQHVLEIVGLAYE
jgi:serine phosphatase RsbU (regulator of sigma subunit)/ADP-heptose:LPS heptosyltransferase/anti-sigma regulatory factor (Ser/Thr protein kinase)/anti-anti-sigma regulatory factor